MKATMMKTTVTAAGLALAAGSAFAAEEEGAGTESASFFDKSLEWVKTDTYAGIHFGTTSADAELSGAFPATAMSVDIDDSDTGYRFFVGKRFMPHLAVELGYANLGEIDVNVEATSSDVPAYLQQLADNVPVAPSGITLDAVTEWTFAEFGAEGDWAERLSVFGRGGLFLWETEVSYSNAGATYSGDDDGIDLHLGLGAAWQINEHFDVRFEWERYMSETEIDSIGLGVTYAF